MGWPVSAVSKTPSHMTRWPRTMVPTGHPRTDFPVKGDQPQRLAIQSSSIVRVAAKSTNVKSNAGTGLGQTYNGKFPTLRIDYILHSPEFKINSFKTTEVNLSDHFPIVSTFN